MSAPAVGRETPTADARVREFHLAEPMGTPGRGIETVFAIEVELRDGDAIGRGSARIMARADADQAVATARGLFTDAIRAIREPADLRTAWSEAWHRHDPRYPEGPDRLALAAIDDAIWELERVRRGAEQPPKISHEPRIYWSGLFQNADVHGLRAETERALAEGYDAVKMRVAASEVDETIERVQTVIDVLGENAQVALEFGRRGTPDSVLAILDAVDQSRLLWVEDPLPPDEVEGLAALAARMEAPLAAGETYWNWRDLLDFGARAGVRSLVVDIPNLGGPTAFDELLRSRGLESFPTVGLHIDVRTPCNVLASHELGPELWVEVIPWWEDTGIGDVRARLG